MSEALWVCVDHPRMAPILETAKVGHLDIAHSDWRVLPRAFQERLLNGAPVQQTIPEPTLPYARPPAPETSRAAAESMRETAPIQRQRVLEWLRGRPSTNDEIEVGMPLPGNSVRPRMTELRAADLVRDSGVRRPTRSGRDAAVWIRTDELPS